MPGTVLNGQHSGKYFLVNQKDLFEKVLLPAWKSCGKAQGAERDVFRMLLNTGFDRDFSRKVFESTVQSSQEKEKNQKQRYPACESLLEKRTVV